MGIITEFHGYAATDSSPIALETARGGLCPFIESKCSKLLSHGAEAVTSGACAVRMMRQDSPDVIICPNRLYADGYQLLKLVARSTFGDDLPLVSARDFAENIYPKGAVVVFGHGWGNELRLPKRDAVGNYFVDWVLARVDALGDVTDFTAIEVQTIDTTGNYRASRDALIRNRSIAKSTVGLNWENVNKRIIPQLVYKGQVLQREQLCSTGLWFVTPKPVFDHIMKRLGGKDNLPFGYRSQPGAIRFFVYDYDPEEPIVDGQLRTLTVLEEHITTVERVQAAFNTVALPEPNVYSKAIREGIASAFR